MPSNDAIQDSSDEEGLLEAEEGLLGAEEAQQ